MNNSIQSDVINVLKTSQIKETNEIVLQNGYLETLWEIICVFVNNNATKKKNRIIHPKKEINYYNRV